MEHDEPTGAAGGGQLKGNSLDQDIKIQEGKRWCMHLQSISHEK
jgi:hypothetical protein